MPTVRCRPIVDPLANDETIYLAVDHGNTEVGEAGNGRSSPRISPYTTRETTGISSSMGTYQRVSEMRLKTTDHFSRSRTPVVLFPRQTKSSAAAMGQKAISALTDRPGISCRSVTLPIHQKGTDSANTSTKNVSGNSRFAVVGKLCAPREHVVTQDPA